MRQRLCHLAELTGDRLLTEHPTTGDPVLVLRDSAGIHVLDGLCPHQYAPLVGGDLSDCILTCPMHEWRFDVRTGEGVDMPVRLERWPAVVEDGWIWLTEA